MLINWFRIFRFYISFIRGKPECLFASGTIFPKFEQLAINYAKSFGDKYSGTTIAPHRLNVVLFTIFAVIAAILSAVGIYTVMAHSVTSKMHERGIRISLGAQRKDLVTMVLKQGMRLVAVGLIAGLFISLSGASVISSLLFEISPGDPKILFDSLLLISVIAFAACLIPAYRAAHIDAQNALHFE
jgi:putative ABC transport system permease protein